MKKPNAKRNAYREEVASDPRSNEELFTELRVCEDDHDWWKIIYILNARQDESLIRRALGICHSDEPELRDIGAALLKQDPDWVIVYFAEECLQTLLLMVSSETNVDVLCSVISASRCYKNRGLLREVIKHKTHPNSDVRSQLVHALDGRTEPEATAALIELSSDDNVDVRNWSTFFLGGNQIDTPEVRDSLRARLLDADDETRSEALAGLATKGDEGVIPFIRKELEAIMDKDNYWMSVLDAVEDMPDPELLPHLIYLWNDGLDYEQVDDAIKWCSILDGVPHGEWDGELTSCPVCGLQHAFVLPKHKICAQCGWKYSKLQINYPNNGYRQNESSLTTSRRRWRLRCRPDLDLVFMQIEASSDTDEIKRRIATCYLSMVDEDTTAIRNALFERLADTNDEIRKRALYGLARRDDERVIPFIRKELEYQLEEDVYWSNVFQASAEMGDPELRPLLVESCDQYEEPTETIKEAIVACTIPEDVVFVEWDGELTSCPVCGLQQAFRLPEQVKCAQCGWLYDLEQLHDPTSKYSANRLSLDQARRRWKRHIGVVS